MLLDTHVWIWMVTDAPRRLGPKTRRHLASVKVGAERCVSTASVFEIAALHVAGRLHFTQPVEHWIRESIAKAGFRVIGLDTSVAIDAGLVSPATLADAIDRCLVATAREYQMPLVTRDRRILEYAARTGLVGVVDASA